MLKEMILSLLLQSPKVQAFRIFFFQQRMSILYRDNMVAGESYLIPCVYKTPEAFNASASLTVIYCFCSISILTTLRAFFHRHVWTDLFVVTYLCYPIFCYVTKCICCFDHGPFRIFLILQYFLLGSI